MEEKLILLLSKIQNDRLSKLRYDTVVESTRVLIGFYLLCERTLCVVAHGGAQSLVR
jgi:hypothetical protein